MPIVQRAENERHDAGFTILEVLIALAVVAAAIVAIGHVMATNTRGVRKLEEHLVLMQTAQAVLATALPPRKEPTEGRRSGELRNYRWQIDIGPVGGAFVADNKIPWSPALVKIRVRSSSGTAIELSTVRLMRKARKQ